MATNSDKISDILKLSDMEISNQQTSSTDTGKRADYLAWEDYFMGIALLAAQRSKDPATQVGTCIINEEKHIVGIGYNGFPINCSDNTFPWTKASDNPLENKYMYVCHAEANAILNKNAVDLKSCSIYTSLFPCNECAKLIIQSRIKEVVYFHDKYAEKPTTIASKLMFDSANVKYRQFIPKSQKIVIDFSKINE